MTIRARRCRSCSGSNFAQFAIGHPERHNRAANRPGVAATLRTGVALLAVAVAVAFAA